MGLYSKLIFPRLYDRVMDKPFWAKHRLNWLQEIVADGCTLTLDVPQLLSTQPFHSVEFDNFYMEQTPRTHGYMFRGTATK